MQPVISDDNNKWIIDSGATRHMAYDKQSFSILEGLKEKITIEIGDGSTINAEGVGIGGVNIKPAEWR